MEGGIVPGNNRAAFSHIMHCEAIPADYLDPAKEVGLSRRVTDPPSSVHS